MNFRHLELFVAVADAGGFTAAAVRLGLEQPAISAVIRRLETELGTALFVRERRNVVLTREGQAFLARAKAILGEIEASRRELVALQSLERGQIVLGAPPMVAGHLLPAVLDEFLTRHPGVQVTVIQAGSEEIGTRVLAGELDLGLVADWRTPDGLAVQLLQLHAMVACVSANSRLAAKRRLGWAELLEEPLVLFPRGYYQRSRLEDAAIRIGCRPNVLLEAESIPLMIELVRRGHGAATLLAAAAAGIEGIRVLPLPADATVPIAVCRRDTGPRSAAATAFEQFIHRQLSRGRPRR